MEATLDGKDAGGKTAHETAFDSESGAGGANGRHYIGYTYGGRGRSHATIFRDSPLGSRLLQCGARDPPSKRTPTRFQGVPSSAVSAAPRLEATRTFPLTFLRAACGSTRGSSNKSEQGEI